MLASNELHRHRPEPFRGLAGDRWDAYKAKHQGETITMSKRGGIGEPSRVIPRVGRVLDWMGYIGLVIILFDLLAAIDVWLGAPIRV